MRMDPPGYYQGRHYTAYVDKVRRLKRAGDLAGAEELLKRLIEATEAESAADGWGVAPWYYEQLAIVYRKQNRPQDEMAILERYMKQRQAPGAKPPKLAERLRRLRESLIGSPG